MKVHNKTNTTLLLLKEPNSKFKQEKEQLSGRLLNLKAT